MLTYGVFSSLIILMASERWNSRNEQVATPSLNPPVSLLTTGAASAAENAATLAALPKKLRRVALVLIGRSPDPEFPFWTPGSYSAYIQPSSLDPVCVVGRWERLCVRPKDTGGARVFGAESGLKTPAADSTVILNQHPEFRRPLGEENGLAPHTTYGLRYTWRVIQLLASASPVKCGPGSK